MSNSKPQRKQQSIDLDDQKTRWYHYALRRLPASLLISIVTLSFVVPVLVGIGVMIYDWFVGG